MKRRIMLMLLIALVVASSLYAVREEVISVDYVITYSRDNGSAQGIRLESDLLWGAENQNWAHGIGLANSLEFPLAEKSSSNLKGTTLFGYKYNSMLFHPLEINVLAGPAWMRTEDMTGVGIGAAIEAEYYFGSGSDFSIRGGLQFTFGGWMNPKTQAFMRGDATYSISGFAGITYRFRAFSMMDREEDDE